MFEGGPPARLNLSKLPAVWQKVAGFEPIPIEKIGPGSRSVDFGSAHQDAGDTVPTAAGRRRRAGSLTDSPYTIRHLKFDWRRATHNWQANVRQGNGDEKTL